MRSITYGGAVSLDGFLAGADGAIDWLHFSPDVQQVIADYWKNVDTVLMGRKTYTQAASQQAGKKKATKAPRSAKARTEPAIRTYVFSRTIPDPDEPGLTVVRSDAAEFVRTLKRSPG